MAFIAAALPYIAAAGTAYAGVKQAQAQDYNAKVAQNEANLSIDQANAQEGQVRRMSREQMGRQAAAFAASGVGYGGSTENALDQSAVNSELDALNTRYKGSITGYGYGVQSGIDKADSQSSYVSAALLAGSQYLKTGGKNYAGSPPQPSSAQNGVQVTF